MSRRVKLPVRALPAAGGSGRAGDREHHPAAEDARLSHSPTLPFPRSAAAGDSLWSALRDVMDPEFPISIVDLGLVYGVRRAGDVVEVDLTFTATACPCMDFIRDDVRERLLREPGVRGVSIREVWSPPWTRDRISADGLAILRRHGVAA